MVPARTLTHGVSGALIALLCLIGCKQQSPTAAAPDPAARAAQQAFVQEEMAWRAQRKEALLQPNGWTSLIGLHWLRSGSNRVGSGPANGTRLQAGPATFGVFTVEKERVQFQPEAGADVIAHGKPVTSTLTMDIGDAVSPPTVLQFDAGKGELTVIKRDGRYALRVKHADAPTRTQFTQLDYWPPARDWVISGRFTPHNPMRTLRIVTFIGTAEEVVNPGTVTFQRDGASYTLEAFDGGDGKLFLVFGDATNRDASYGAGRFLDTDMPERDGRVELNFNRAYNPPCAFTAFATCPLPPAGNRLPLAIPAGEKRYHGAAAHAGT